MVKNPSAMRETWVWSLGSEDPLEKRRATHSNIPGWRIHGQRSLEVIVHGVTKSQNQTRLSDLGLPWWLRWYRICLWCQRPGFDPLVGKILWRRKQQPIPVFLPGKFHGQRSLEGYSPKGHKESDMQRLEHTHIHILNIQILCLYFKDIFQNVQIFFFSYL